MSLEHSFSPFSIKDCRSAMFAECLPHDGSEGFMWRITGISSDCHIFFFSFCSVFVTRSRAHETLARGNPTAAARRWSLKVARRVYRAPHLNSLLHIDGKACLMRILLPDLPYLFNIWKILSASVTQNTQHYNHFQVFVFLGKPFLRDYF